MMIYAGFVARMLLAVVFLTAALGKARYHADFQQTLQRLGFARLIAPMITWVIILYETSLAMLFVTGRFTLIVTVATACFVLGCVGVSLYAFALRQQIPCRCFGKSSSPLGVQTIAHALLLVLPAGIYFLSSLWTRNSWWPSDMETLVVLASLTLAGILLASWLLNTDQLFA